MADHGTGDFPGSTDGPAAACAVCGAPNRGTGRFCSECGSPLGKDSELVARAVRATVPEAVDRALREGRPPADRTMKCHGVAARTRSSPSSFDRP